MNATAFVDLLASLRPSLAALTSRGIDSEGAAELRARFEFRRRSSSRDYGLADEALNELFSHYDPCSAHIGAVRFETEPMSVSDGWLIGIVGGDYLVLQRLDGEINVRDIAAPYFVMWPCAENGTRLLDALAVTARYLSCLSVGREPEGSAPACAVQCGQLAGGERYQQFYEMLLGVE